MARTRVTTTIAAVFLWIVVAGIAAKVFRAVDLWRESRAGDGFTWLPLGAVVELLAAGIVAGIVAVASIAAARLVPKRARSLTVVAAAVLGAADVAWQALNLVSFRITQAPLTFQRVRGDEGVHFRDFGLVQLGDLAPSILFVVVALAALPLAVFAARRLALSRRALTILVAVGAAAWTVDAVAYRDANFGVADDPVLGLFASVVHAYVDETRALTAPPPTSPDALHDLLVPTHPRAEIAVPPRGRAQMQNAIVFFSEGIARKQTSFGGVYDSTPNAMRRFHDVGLEVTRYHAPYHKSIAAIYSFVCSDAPPPSGRNIVETNPRIDCGELSDVLAQNQIHTGLFHGGQFGFYDKLALLGMRGYEDMEDAHAIADPGVVEENEWGVDDRAMIDHVLAWIDTLPPGDRFTAVIIPITAHYPYWIPSDADVAFPGAGSKEHFLSAVHFLDEAFERLMRGLEQRGLAGDTAVIYLADHGETVGERPRRSAGRRLAYEPSLHVPFMILAPGMWPGGSSTDRLASHEDLLPTVLDLLGLPPDPRHHGRSILAPDREPERVFIGAQNGPTWVGFLDGDVKFLVNRTTGAREAYDLAKDPDERHDVAKEIVDADAMERDVLAFADGHTQEIVNAKKRDAEIDLQAAFLASAEAVVRKKDGTTAPATFTREKVLVAKVKRDCVVVTTPQDGALELAVHGAQRWFPLLSRVRAGLTERVRGEGTERVQIAVESDGELTGPLWLSGGGDRRVGFSPPRDDVIVRVEGDGDGRMKRDVCLTFTDRAWRGLSAP